MRQTKSQRDRGEKKEERERVRERGGGVSLSRETVPSVDTSEGRYNAAKTQI